MSDNSTSASSKDNKGVVTQTQRTKTGCQNCRIRHLKCDDTRPSCSQCSKANIECIRGFNIRFKHGANPSVANLEGSGLAKTENDFDKEQTWVKTARHLTFFDETPDLINIYDHEPDENNPYPTPFHWPDNNSAASPARSQPPAQSTRTTQGLHRRTSQASDSSATRIQTSERPEAPRYPWPDVASEPAHEKQANPAESPANSQTYSEHFPGHNASESESLLKRRRLDFDAAYQSSATPDSPVHHLIQSPADSWHTGWTPITSGQHSRSDVDASALSSVDNGVSQSLSRIYLDSPVWPLTDKEEAKLLRHFVENISRNFDLTDPLKHFRQVVPQRAAVCPMLMNAIFAMSARHLSRIGDYDPLISNRYHQECLKHLIPMLDDTSAILDENLLASTIILRHLEEFEVPISGQAPADQHSHLLGAQAFIAAQERAAVTGGLRQAAFWVGLRQEVYVAFVNQRPVLPALEHCNVDRSFDAAEDHIWACRMVVLCADVLRYCFGDAIPTVTSFKYLEDQVAQWHDSKPPSFTPVYYHAPSFPTEIFPEIWFVADEHATGVQHYHLARILLRSHDPRIPRLGPGRATALRAMDDEIRQRVRVLCGISQSNRSCSPSFTYAAMACTMAGDKFTERREQEALLDVLDQCDRCHAWPTGMAIRNLKVAWGWEETENWV